MNVQRASFCAGKRVWIARHAGPTGAAIIKRLWSEGCDLVLTTPYQLDLRRRRDLQFWMEELRPDAIVLADGFPIPGGVVVDHVPKTTRFIVDNVLATAQRTGVEWLVQIVPNYPEPPLSDLRTGTLLSPGRRRARSAALAAIHAIHLTEDYVKRHGCHFVALAAPTVYTPDWTAEWGAPHFLSALVSSLGSALLRGARRCAIISDYALLPPMMHAEDLADAAVFAADHCEGCSFLRCGSDENVPVDQLVRLVADVVGFRGPVEIRYRRSAQAMGERPTGCSLEALGWESRIPLREGILEIYDAWFTRQIAAVSGLNFRQ